MEHYILGLDLGTNSVGWAIVECDANLEPKRLERWGSWIFPDAIESEDKGTPITALAERGRNRRARRTLRRRKQRRAALVRVLQSHGMLPTDPVEWKILFQSHTRAVDQGTLEVHPYALRARGVSERLSLWEFGRVLYHMCRRRGYISTREVMLRGVPRTEVGTLDDTEADAGAAADQGGQEEERSRMLKQIAETRNLLSGSTLGEASYVRMQQGLGVRARMKTKGGNKREITMRADRRMYEEEFNRLWERQERFYPETLTLDLRNSVYKALFDQRSLRQQSDKKGKCSIDPRKPRCAKASLVFQRYQIAQYLHTLSLSPAVGEPQRPLARAERRALFEVLTQHAQLGWREAKELLGLPAEARFSDEPHPSRGSGRGAQQSVRGRKALPGSRTAEVVTAICGDAWNQLAPYSQDKLVSEILTIRTAASRYRRLQNAWKMGEREAARLATIDLPEGYAAYCERVLRILTKTLIESDVVLGGDTLLRAAGFPVEDKTLAGQERTREQALDQLDPRSVQIRQPVVAKSVRQAFRVINSAIAMYGMPAIVRIEVPRDVARSAKSREAVWKAQDERQQERKQAAKILREHGLPENRRNIERVLLAEECGWQLPYEPEVVFSVEELINDDIHVDHIVPRSHACDDSFGNKTLCGGRVNIAKGGRTPFEMYCESNSPLYSVEAWERMKAHVSRLSTMPKGKRNRILSQTRPEGGFVGRHLSSTGYLSLAVRDAVKTLGVPVEVRPGSATALLRRLWGLHSVLPPTEEEKEWMAREATGEIAPGRKNRADHRHHAVDAAVVALTSVSALQSVARYFQDAERGVQREKRQLAKPWPTLDRDLKAQIGEAHVVHRPTRKVQGPLHKAMPRTPPAQIRVQGKEVRDGKLLVPGTQGVAQQAYPLEYNHHTVIWEALQENSEGIRERRAEVVPRIEASRRIQADEPLFQRYSADGMWRAAMHLCMNDIVEWTGDEPGLRRVASMSQERSGGVDMVLLPPEMAVPQKGQEKRAPYRIRSRASLNGLVRRIGMSPMGELCFAEG